MKIVETPLAGVLLIEPRVFDDARGYFMETYHKQRFRQADLEIDFVQDNLSFSKQNTVRGLHYQHPRAQAKLVQVLQGEVFDVVVDIRRGSPTFGRSCSAILSAANQRQLLVPTGFAHGFCVLSATAVFVYKCSDYYTPDCEGGVLWRDPDLGIDWPIREGIVSPKDAALPCLKDIAAARLPVYG